MIYQGLKMKTLALTLFLFGILTQEAQATTQVRACGWVTFADSPHSTMDRVGTGYSMTVDCNRNHRLDRSERSTYLFKTPASLSTIGSPELARSSAGRKAFFKRVFRGDYDGALRSKMNSRIVCVDLEAEADVCHDLRKTAEVAGVYHSCLLSSPNCLKSISNSHPSLPK